LSDGAVSPQRIGLFGGSFDPVHVAHVALARCALEQLALDAVWWIPAGRNWQKGGTAAGAAQRAAMIALAIDGEPRFRLERCELDRAGPSYTIDTVRALRQREPGTDWTLILGQDQYAGLPSWHEWRELVSLVTLAVAGRADAAPRAPAPLAAVPHRAVALAMPAMAVSATEIRARIARGEDITALVPPGVARYIDQHHLYRGTP
jgi:nicotinate-nucleotide adenylyltransferase